MKNKKGFTLVELLAVIAILAILVIMALPAVLRMFNTARKDTFNNELNTIIRTTKQQYLLSGGQAAIYSKESNPLSLTGNSELNYCITINGEGKIIDFKATNGSYKYESNGIVSETSSDDIVEIDGEYLLECGPIRFVNRQNEGSITVGDEVAIDTEHFYVISSNSSEMVLLAKYNILVGGIYNSSDGGSTWTFTKELTTNDEGYGLQSESAKGYYSGCTERTGVVAFSPKSYWDNDDCVWVGPSYNSASCPGTEGLKSEYANESNSEGTTGNYSPTRPYVYNSSMSSVAPSYGTYTTSEGTLRAAQDNGYTVAYYVEEYVNRLKRIGALNNITGRLLTREEAASLSSTIRGDWSYLLGSAKNKDHVYRIYAGNFGDGHAWLGSGTGVRPVIVVSTFTP